MDPPGSPEPPREPPRDPPSPPRPWPQRLPQRGRTELRNRRYAALRELIREGEYFSEERLRRRAPALFQRYIGRFRAPRGPKNPTGTPRGLPGDPRTRGDPETARNGPKNGPETARNGPKNGPKTAWNGPKNDPGTAWNGPKNGPGTAWNGPKNDPKNGPKNGPGTAWNGPKNDPKNDPKNGPGTAWNGPKNGPGTAWNGPKNDPKNDPKNGPKRGPELRELLLTALENNEAEDDEDEDEEEEDEDEDEDEEELPGAAEQELLRQEFLSLMHLRFLEGLDSDYDYRQLEGPAAPEALALLCQDLEDRYFDEEEPGPAPPLL